jgi:hypothetical protein
MRGAPDPYKVVTFHVDASATEQISAVADTGARLRVFWSVGFTAGSRSDPVVRDSNGIVIVADGDVVAMPAREFPRLHGYFVCAGPTALYVLAKDPA